jgi:hypothetical protein
MDLNKIQIIFEESMKINKIIENIKLPNGISSTNDKIKAYLNIKAEQIIKIHNPYLDFNVNNIHTKNNIFVLDNMPKYVFMVAYTISHTNHPYFIYLNLDDKYINVLIPIGKDFKQATTQDYINVINSITNNKSQKTHNKNPLLVACYLFLKDTLKTRVDGILYSQYSILTCDNMTLCHNKMNEINKIKISENEYNKIYNQNQDYYMKIGIELLQRYFNLLENKNYSEAYELLKGGTSKFSKYYGKTRLNNFFKNNKKLIGHLEVFISLYELLHMARMKLLNY